MAGLKVVKSSPTTKIEPKMKRSKSLTNDLLDYSTKMVRKHRFGKKPLPAGGIEFFENAQTKWPDTWNDRLNRTAYFAKIKRWEQQEFTEVFQSIAPNPDDPACLAVIKSVFENKDISRGDGNDSGDSGKRVRAAVIEALSTEVETFRTADNRPFVRLKGMTLPNSISIASDDFSTLVKKRYYEITGGTVSEQSATAIVAHFEGQALFRSEVQEVHLRVARHEKDVYLSLGKNGCIRIFPNPNQDFFAQGFEYITSPPVNFLRTRGMSDLPRVELDDWSRPLEVLSVLFEKFINITSKEERILFISALILYLIGGDFVVMVFEGEQGSGKSTAMEFAKKVIDPAPVLKKALPPNAKGIYVIAQHFYVLAFDNVSGISKEVSDCLCQISTGGSMLDRSLFTDSDVAILSAKRPTIVNGIEASPSRPDLIDRSVIFHIDPISKRRPKNQMEDEFDNLWPQFLTALVQISSYALARAPEIVDFGNFRMTDYAKIGCATAEYLGLGQKFFVDAYEENRYESSTKALENDIVAMQILRNLRPNQKFSGSATQLFTITKANLKPESFSSFPPNVYQFGIRLRRIAPELRRHGVIFKEDKRNSSARPISIQMPGPEEAIWLKLDAMNSEMARDFGNPEVENDNLI